MNQSFSLNAAHRSDLGGIDLHDCCIVRIDLHGDFAVLDIPRGVWLLPGHPENPEATLCKTRGATARIPTAVLPRALAVRPLRSSAKPSPLPWSRLLRRVNTQGWQIEIYSHSLSEAFVWLEGLLWQDPWKPALERALTLRSSAIEILWNEIDPTIRG